MTPHAFRHLLAHEKSNMGKAGQAAPGKRRKQPFRVGKSLQETGKAADIANLVALARHRENGASFQRSALPQRLTVVLGSGVVIVGLLG